MASLKNVLLVDSKLAEDRMQVCHQCPFFLSKHQSCGTPIIGDLVSYEGKEYRTCGCWMPLKTKLQGTACPVGKWGDQEIESQRFKEAQVLLSEIGSLERITRDQATRLRSLYRLLLSRDADPGECGGCLREIRDLMRKHLKDDKGIQAEAEPPKPQGNKGRKVHKT